MTGRDLILYILENGLENEPVMKDGGFLGFLTPEEVAVEQSVGTATVLAWISIGKIQYIKLAGKYYIPAVYKTQLSGVKLWND